MFSLKLTSAVSNMKQTTNYIKLKLVTHCHAVNHIIIAQLNTVILNWERRVSCLELTSTIHCKQIWKMYIFNLLLIFISFLHLLFHRAGTNLRAMTCPCCSTACCDLVVGYAIFFLAIRDFSQYSFCEHEWSCPAHPHHCLHVNTVIIIILHSVA